MGINAGLKSPGLPNRAIPSQRIEGNFPVEDGKKVLPEYDAIVIGGGINGTAIARDLATRQPKRGEPLAPGQGLKVLLLEKDDFGGATSAHNSRLIHGGIRYLEYKEFDLVMESLQERERLLRNAPHLVRPLASLMPVFDYNTHGIPILKLGMFVYDRLSSSWLQGRMTRNMPKHARLSKNGFAEAFPGVRQDQLKGGFLYYDAQVRLAERLSVENAIAAKKSGNATVLNHAEVTGSLPASIAQANREAAGVTFRDRLTGEEYVAKAKVVINAAGPWVDDILQKIAVPPAVANAPQTTSPEALASSHQLLQRIGGVAGAHIIVPKFPGAPEAAVYFEAKDLQDPKDKGRRMIFILPWFNGNYLIGTTEHKLEGTQDLDTLAPTPNEIPYLLREVNGLIPEAKLTPADILDQYYGVRPLPFVGKDKSAHEVTRHHIIENHAKASDQPIPRLFSIISGKLTTMRSLAEKAGNDVIKAVGLRMPDGAAIGKSQTRNTPLPGGEGMDNGVLEEAEALDPAGFKEANEAKRENIRVWAYKRLHVEKAAQEYQAEGITAAQVSHLIDIYGSRYREVLSLIDQDPSLAAPLYPGSADIKAQVVHAINEEAQTVTDVIARRICNRFEPERGLKAVRPAAEVMGRRLNWPSEKIEAEIQAYTRWINKDRKSE